MAKGKRGGKKRSATAKSAVQNNTNAIPTKKIKIA